ncbi:hypothetical protein E2986_12465 [Frieseomelitta varia]|uniref:Uncharacterized protein n=1 Tax=Frieseomelitta varia TaxID=561572 RepID=A0A833VJ88_9HYME|nr:hypothetical protein E2986_12465 [Frieseomelitta varia]
MKENTKYRLHCYTYCNNSSSLTPLKGIGLRKENYPNSMAEAGPICKKAEDLIPILKTIIGEKASLLNLDAEVDIRCLNIFYQESSGDIRTSRVNWEMRTALLKAVQHFKEITGSVTKCSTLLLFLNITSIVA